MRPTTIAASLLLLAGTALPLATAEGDAIQPRPLTLDQLPAPAQDTVRVQAGDQPIVAIQVDQAGPGGPVYRVQVRREGGDRHLVVTPDGQLLDSHATADRPLGEEAAARTEEAWEKTKEVSKEGWEKTKEVTAKGWEKTKEATAKGWEKTKEFGGTVIDQASAALDDDGLTIEHVPAAVKATILSQAAGREIKDIDVDARRGKVFYQAAIRVPDAEDITLRVAEDGGVLGGDF